MELNVAELNALADKLEQPLPANVVFDMGVFYRRELDSRGTRCAYCAGGFALLDDALAKFASPFSYPDKLAEKFGKETLVGSSYVWLFAALWQKFDNTPRGAAKRVRYFAKRGRPPLWFIKWSYSSDYFDMGRDDATLKRQYANWRRRSLT